MVKVEPAAAAAKLPRAHPTSSRPTVQRVRADGNTVIVRRKPTQLYDMVRQDPKKQWLLGPHVWDQTPEKYRRLLRITSKLRSKFLAKHGGLYVLKLLQRFVAKQQEAAAGKAVTSQSRPRPRPFCKPGECTRACMDVLATLHKAPIKSWQDKQRVTCEQLRPEVVKVLHIIALSHARTHEHWVHKRTWCYFNKYWSNIMKYPSDAWLAFVASETAAVPVPVTLPVTLPVPVISADSAAVPVISADSAAVPAVPAPAPAASTDYFAVASQGVTFAFPPLPLLLLDADTA
jgi:hypothetical protein